MIVEGAYQRARIGSIARRHNDNNAPKRARKRVLMALARQAVYQAAIVVSRRAARRLRHQAASKQRKIVASRGGMA